MNWLEIPISLPHRYSKLVEEMDPKLIKEIPEPHLTILYGFDPSLYDDVKFDFDSFEISEKDFQFGRVKCGDVSPVYLLEVISPRLQECFWFLYNKYDNEHTLIDGKFFDPHVTLCWFHSSPQDLPAIKLPE
jgi:hypothetical protein